jgi:lysophospholipase L1-like esterase
MIGDCSASSNTIVHLTTSMKQVLCYGDSLTEGMVPLARVLHPYAQSLQRVLRTHPSLKDVVVQHQGLPGWTSAQTVRDVDGVDGLRLAISEIANPPPSLVIILAGTNDLGNALVASFIAEPIQALHAICYEEGIPHTIRSGSLHRNTNQQTKLYQRWRVKPTTSFKSSVSLKRKRHIFLSHLSST